MESGSSRKARLDLEAQVLELQSQVLHLSSDKIILEDAIKGLVDNANLREQALEAMVRQVLYVHIEVVAVAVVCFLRSNKALCSSYTSLIATDSLIVANRPL